MANSLKSTLSSLAEDFATRVVEAIRNSSIDDLLEHGRKTASPRSTSTSTPATPRRGKGGRLARRSVDELVKVSANIVALVAKHPDGLRAEQIREQLGLSAKELPRPLGLALSERRLTKKGEKRATTYFAAKRRGAN